MQIYKLQVKVDDHVGDIFSLPCVYGVIKDESTGTPMYQLKYVKDEATGMLRNYALPGDTLAQTIQGYWYVIRQKD